MTSPSEISVDQLSRLIGLPDAPAIIDVRIDEDFALDPRLIPASRRRSHKDIEDWQEIYRGRKVVVVCHRGKKLSQGVASLLRHEGIEAAPLALGFEGWADAGMPAVDPTKLPPRDGEARTLWVTRARPGVDGTASSWLIRRFIDPDAVILFATPVEVMGVAEKFGAAPFVVEGGFGRAGDEQCAFDSMLAEFGLTSDPLAQLATIVRGAESAQFEQAPEAAGLLAAVRGLSRIYSDDLAQLSASFEIYDALYRWRRDVRPETQDWPATETVAA